MSDCWFHYFADKDTKGEVHRFTRANESLRSLKVIVRSALNKECLAWCVVQPRQTFTFAVVVKCFKCLPLFVSSVKWQLGLLFFYVGVIHSFSYYAVINSGFHITTCNTAVLLAYYFQLVFFSLFLFCFFFLFFRSSFSLQLPQGGLVSPEANLWDGLLKQAYHKPATLPVSQPTLLKHRRLTAAVSSTNLTVRYNAIITVLYASCRIIVMFFGFRL